jgi:hypothetical protein
MEKIRQKIMEARISVDRRASIRGYHNIVTFSPANGEKIEIHQRPPTHNQFEPELGYVPRMWLSELPSGKVKWLSTNDIVHHYTSKGKVFERKRVKHHPTSIRFLTDNEIYQMGEKDPFYNSLYSHKGFEVDSRTTWRYSRKNKGK